MAKKTAQLSPIYASAEYDDGKPTGRILIKSVTTDGQVSVGHVAATLDVSGAADLIRTIAAVIGDITKEG